MRRFLLCISLFATLHGCGGTSDGGDDDGSPVVSLTIEPADPTVTSINGSRPEIAFQVLAEREDGTIEAVAGAWSLDEARIGAIGPADGAFVASGFAAGQGTVTAMVDGQRATTTVTVVVEDELLGDGVAPTDPGRFGTPMPGAGAPTILYPLDGVVMPATIKAPHVQWELGDAGDLFRVELVAGLATVRAYLLHGGGAFDFAWAIDADSWRRLVNSAGSAPISLTVDRLAASDGLTWGATPVAMTIADANLDGAIYYWDLAAGKMLRITDDGRDDFMPTPPAKPENGSRCIACHTVSRDGRYLAAELWGGNEPGAIFDLSQDLSGDPAPTVVAPGAYTALFSTFNPDASRLLINAGTRLDLIDAATGLVVPSTGLPQTGAAHPTWSPDGATIAYIANHDGGWAVDFNVGDLAVLPVSGTDFGPPTVLRAADGLANSWPTFSPDSQWIAFGRGTNSRGRRDDIGQVYPGALWMIPRAGGAPVELAAANGGAQDSYLPNFSPFDSGGYFWLAFYSTRDYGNAQVGTRGSGRRQLWVTAISNDPQAGVDPSHVPFWLPDQDSTSDNMSAYWAVRPPVD